MSTGTLTHKEAIFVVTIKNRWNQPFTVNIPDQEALYFGPRESKQVTMEQYNAPEMQAYIAAGIFLVIRIA